MCLATVAARFPTLEDHPPLVQNVEAREGTWERVHAALRKRLRVRMKRDPQPSAGVVDSQGRSRAPVWEGIGEVMTEERR